MTLKQNKMNVSNEREFIKQFIKKYQLHPCLWNAKIKEYSNKSLRNDAYEELLDFCKEKYPTTTKDAVVKKIHALRCSFKRELKKVRDSQRNARKFGGDTYVPNLWYFDLLSFIADSVTQKKKKPSLDLDINNDEQVIL